MELQWIGVIAAACTFFGVWFGHVTVRKIEAQVENLWLPIALTLALGLSLELWSLVTTHLLLSTVTGILGVTLLWDCFEFVRQQKRVIKGHTPANPSNPRHARILKESQAATTHDLLDRDPVGHPVSPDEAIQLVTEKRA